MNTLEVRSGSPYEDKIGFSRARKVGNQIAISGSAPILSDGTNAFPEDAYSQALRCFEVIQEALEKAGGSLEGVIRTRIYLVRQDIWQDVARAHGEFFKGINPASTFIVVAGLLNDEWLVEIEADAVLEP